MNHRILKALMASTVLGLVASPVVSAEITGPTSSTYVIGDHDSLTITSSGSIAVTGNDNDGVDGYDDANHITVINNGSITTNGLRSDGITVRDFDANAG
ncbi:hypothetical protein, partial [Oricola sp.]|uniref:hypothetical protein n=1 Tax=Oricola sp. TaxID=1979950 RepID=UPI0025EDCA7E